MKYLDNKDYIPSLKLGFNTKGSDFFIGDSHGCTLEIHDRLIKEEGFNTKTDRMFFLGDLIDRGPNSIGALEVLDKDYAYSILGNHDQMLLASLSDSLSYYEDQERLPTYTTNKMSSASPAQYKSLWLRNGGTWCLEESDANLEKIKDVFYELPIVINIGDGDGRDIGLVHADIPNRFRLSWADFFTEFDTGKILETDPEFFQATWNRTGYEVDIYHYLNPDKMKGLIDCSGASRVLMGHNGVPEITKVNNRYYLDTWYIHNCRLTYCRYYHKKNIFEIHDSLQNEGWKTKYKTDIVV